MLRYIAVMGVIILSVNASQETLNYLELYQQEVNNALHKLADAKKMVDTEYIRLLELHEGQLQWTSTLLQDVIVKCKNCDQPEEHLEQLQTIKLSKEHILPLLQLVDTQYQDILQIHKDKKDQYGYYQTVWAAMGKLHIIDTYIKGNISLIARHLINIEKVCDLNATIYASIKGVEIDETYIEGLSQRQQGREKLQPVMDQIDRVYNLCLPGSTHKPSEDDIIIALS